jgi:hypothetical protein
MVGLEMAELLCVGIELSLVLVVALTHSALFVANSRRGTTMHWKFAVALLAISSGVMYAQAPPVKMGLWEKTITMTGEAGETSTMKAKSCVTQVSWQQMVQNSQKQRPGCEVKRSQSDNSYTYSGSCSTAHGLKMTFSGSATIRDAEHIVSESHSTSTLNGKTRQSDMKAESHFVSASCGNIKPGESDDDQ